MAVEHLFPYSGGMSTDRLTAAYRLLSEAVDALCDMVGPGAGDDELLSVLTLCEGVARRLDRVVVDAVADLERRGVFTQRGYRNPAGALADLLGWERFEARRRVTVADAVCERVGLDGAVLPPKLPATAEAFADGSAGLRHVEVIARVLASESAGRLAPQVWAGAEQELADKAAVYTPAELAAWGAALVEALDEDGPEPDERGPVLVNELHLTGRRGGGGFVKGRFDDPALYDAIVTVIDAKARPLTSDDDRTPAQRNAEALAEVCGYVLDHGDVPQRGGERPHLNILVRLEDLENRARSAMLDFGGTLSPESLRMLACDAAVIPIVMNGVGQPLDVGRVNRSIPDGLRRAVAARDRGCAHPGCGRTASWCEIHHIREWWPDGETKLDNLVMLCRVHHRLLHHSEWVVRTRDGLPEFIPPRWLDMDQTPRRKPLTHLAGQGPGKVTVSGVSAR